MQISTGISFNTLSNTTIGYDKDVWYHPHNATGYSSGAITLHHEIIMTDDYDTRGGSLNQTMRDVNKWLDIMPHELGHRVQSGTYTWDGSNWVKK